MKIIGILLVFSAIAHSSAQLLRRRETGETNPHLFEERIIGGFQAPIARYQYTVSLQRDDDHFCGGSLIAPDVVLSAAHCKFYLFVSTGWLSWSCIVLMAMIHLSLRRWTSHSDCRWTSRSRLTKWWCCPGEAWSSSSMVQPFRHRQWFQFDLFDSSNYSRRTNRET